MSQFLVTWSVQVESDSADGARETALDWMACEDISPEIKELPAEDLP